MAWGTGSAVFVIDRAANALALARAFDPQGFGRLGLLDAHEPHGVESCDATLEETRQAGTQVSRGPWQIPRAEDPRHGVLVAPGEGKTFVSWGTPRVQATVAPTAWPQVYRERHERQANSFKRMLAHGALHTTYGRTKSLGVDRHQQRVREHLDHALEAAQKRVATQGKAGQTPQAKGGESTSKGHGKRLEHRQRTVAVVAKAYKDAQHPHGPRAAHAATVGPPGARADRDGRTQTSMTVRTLLFEHAGLSFLAVLVGFLKTKVRLDCLLTLLFARSGARMETATQVVYWLNTAGLSVPYHRRLAEVVDGLCAMDLREQGKPLHVRLKTLPP